MDIRFHSDFRRNLSEIWAEKTKYRKENLGALSPKLQTLAQGKSDVIHVQYINISDTPLIVLRVRL